MKVNARGYLAALGIALLAATSAGAQSPSTVLVVANANNAQSVALADYYMAARQVPASNKLLLSWTAADSADTITQSAYISSIATPIYSKIATLDRIDYIVLCRNLPTKISGSGSVDSALAGHIEKGSRTNPYFWRSDDFSSAKYGIYLVTRLDGWSWDDARALVDRSMSATAGGTIFLDSDPCKSGGYVRWNNQLASTPKAVTDPDVTVTLDATNTFVNPGYPLAGYASWGSNDSHFCAANWKAIQFAPGAIAETAVSTSAMYLRTQPTGGQSQISQLIHDGVTGVKGYVAEPFLTAIADPSILFARYTAGLNLAEAFYSASSYVCWKDVVLGDPLCSPYSTAGSDDGDTNPLTNVKATPLFSIFAATGAPGDTIHLKTLLLYGETPVIGGTVQFSVDDTAVGSATSDASGASLAWTIPSSMTAGVHNVTASFAGDSTYTSTTRTTAALTVSVPPKAGVAFSLYAVRGMPGQTVTLKTLVCSGGAPLAGKIVQFQVDDVAVGSATSDANGAALSYTIPDSMELGAHDVTVSFAGDSAYNSASRTTAALTTGAPPRAGVSFSLFAASGSPGQTVTLKALMCSGGAPLTGKLVQLLVDNVDAGSATSDASGVALTYTIPDSMAAGIHNVTVCFAGDASYNSATRTTAALSVKGANGEK